ncbi:MAG: ribosomal-processing cysteine protease Prp [Firmicutes bacterium]|nr:ribosomal-processing cysteine protease Prp [Bacillota bacterium]
MIKININKDEITIKGHSGYANEGSDIVCASISSIAITTVNSLLRIDEDCIEYQENDGYLNIKVKKHNEIIDKLIENMIDLFKELENDYKKYIEIR